MVDNPNMGYNGNDKISFKGFEIRKGYKNIHRNSFQD